MIRFFKDFVAPICVVVAVLGLVGKHLYKHSDSYLKDRIVRLYSPHGMCTGEQIVAPSGQTYILSAAHCIVLQEDGSISVKTEDGQILRRRVIAEDVNSDLLLIEGLPNRSGLLIAKSSYPHEKVRTLTHGHNLDTYETDGELIQTMPVTIPFAVIDDKFTAEQCALFPKNKVVELDEFFLKVKACAISIDEIFSTAQVVPGSSGGPVFDSSSGIVGVVSATDGKFSSFVTLEDIHNFLRGY